MTIREQLRGTLTNVLSNATNLPERIQTRILGLDMGPLTNKMTDAALAVFEEAHTPTDDERDALDAVRGWIGSAGTTGPGSRVLSTLLGMAEQGFRRSEVPEPSTEQLAVYRKLADRAHAALALPRGRVEATKQLAGLALPLSVALDHLLAAESQGEEDERIEAWHYVADHEAFKGCYDGEQPLIDSVLARITAMHEAESTINELAPAREWTFRTVRGEPSDAAVLAALNATVRPDQAAPDLTHWGIEASERMRASLRAAAEVRTQGEPSDAQVACPHWAPGKITFRNGCTACAAETGGEGR